MNCQDFRELIDSYLSDELLTETNHGVLRHLEQCGACRKVTEDRRGFRDRLRSAVRNCRQYQISENFNEQLQSSLRRDALSGQNRNRSVFRIRYALAAAAAGFIMIAAVGIFSFLNFSGQPERAGSIEQDESVSYHAIALGDHKLCAIEHDMEEAPVAIDLFQPQNAVLKEAIQLPLKQKFGRCELVEAHTCRFQGRSFTHLIFRPEGKTMSVLILDIPRAFGPEDGSIARVTMEGYQVAYFDVGQKAVFVVSDLPEHKNLAAAEIVEIPLREKFTEYQQARLIPEFGKAYAAYREREF